jgi:Na+/proline symporter
MQLPSFLQGDSPSRLVQGAIAGALATLIVGFYWGGWVTGGNAKEMVQKSTTAAVVSALAPICVDKFERSADASAKLTELKKVSSWQQGSFVEQGGWATMPGSDTANSAVAEACARMLGELKK